MATTPTNLRLDSEAKKKAFEIFDQVGLKPVQAINLFLHQVVLHGGLPFEVKIPNQETREAMEELLEGKGKRFGSTKELFDELDL